MEVPAEPVVKGFVNAWVSVLKGVTSRNMFEYSVYTCVLVPYDMNLVPTKSLCGNMFLFTPENVALLKASLFC